MKETVSFGDFMDVIISMADGAWGACRIRPPESFREQNEERREREVETK